MLKIIFLLILLVFLSSELVLAQKIFLQYSFFGGPEFSTDSITFKEVGMNVNEIKEIMKDNEASMDLLDSYESNLMIGTILSYSGGFLIGWPLGGYIGSGGEWKSSYSTMLIVGASLAVVATIFNLMAFNNLDEAIENYNSHSKNLAKKINFNLGYNSTMSSIQLSLLVNLN